MKRKKLCQINVDSKSTRRTKSILFLDFWNDEIHRYSMMPRKLIELLGKCFHISLRYTAGAFLLLLLISTPFNSAFAQKNKHCHVEVDRVKESMPILRSGNAGDCYPDAPGPFYLNVYAHALNHLDCTGAPSDDEIGVAMQRLTKNFEQHNIFLLWEDCLINEVCIEDAMWGFFALSVACLPSDPECIKYYFHDDGLDIFFAPTEGVFFSGGASRGAIPTSNGQAVAISGEFWEPPFDPIIETDVLTHEVGHALGLFHTFQDWDDCPDNELVDQSNCEDCGDLVCDTPPDVYGNELFTIDPVQCAFDTGGETDINGDAYDPDERNYMSYAPPGCIAYFSSCQAERMRYMINTSGSGGPNNSGNLNDCLYNFDSVNETITSDQTWSPGTVGDVVTVNGTLTISAGATLTIASGTTVKFAPNAKLVVKARCLLILEGTLTSFCGKTWKGVEVNGSDPSNSQFPDVNGVYLQGRFQGIAGAVIENAEIGVQLWGPDLTKAGGHIHCTETTFRNNHVGVEFAPYLNFDPMQGNTPAPYEGSFTKCIFELEQEFLSPVCIEMRGVENIQVLGCDFTNYAITNPDGSRAGDWGYGILAFDSSFDLLPFCADCPPADFKANSFNLLGCGVFTGKLLENRACTIREAIFDNCIYGIRNRGVNGSIIAYNELSLGNMQSPQKQSHAQVGISFESAITDFTCQENIITGEGVDGNTTIGTFCKYTGETNKSIRKNTFDGLTVGSLANGFNGVASDISSGVTYRCNVNTNVEQYDIDVDFTNGLIHRFQAGEAGQGAGNLFSGTGIGFSNTGDDDQLNYRHHVSVTPPSTNGNVTITNNGLANPCVVEVQLTPIKDPCAELIAAIDNYNVAEASWTTSSGQKPSPQVNVEIRRYRAEMDRYASEVIRILLAKKDCYDRQTLLAWIERLKRVEGELWRSSEYLSDGDVTMALQVLNDIPVKFNLSSATQRDVDNYKSLVQLIDNKSAYQLSITDRQAISAYENMGGFTQGWVRNILSYYEDDYDIEYIITDPVKKTKKELESASTILKVHPNPATEVVYFKSNFSDIAEDLTVIINDISGKVMTTLKDENELNVIWDVTNVPSGIYFYQFISEGQLLESGKVIVAK